MGIRIIVADDQTIMREGLCSLLEKHDDIEVVAQADSGRSAVELAARLKPDVVVMDITMPKLNGIQATRKILTECPGVKVIALSVHSERQFVEGMLAAGANGYLLKDCAARDLADAIHTVVKNQSYLSPSVTGIVVEGYRHHVAENRSTGLSALTEREREILQMLAEGKERKQVASLLNISPRTVETHRRHIMKKLNAASNAELTRIAIRQGLTPL
jgi:two-component system, NarL family, response regulator NreC